MAFINDLQEGKQFERHVREWFEETFFRLEDGPLKGVDFVSVPVNLEVKMDRRMRETGNLFLETSHKGNDSGIYKGNFNLFAYGDYEGIFLFQLQNLLRIEEESEHRKINAGDGWNSKGMLIGMEEAKKWGTYVSFKTMAQGAK